MGRREKPSFSWRNVKLARPALKIPYPRDATDLFRQRLVMTEV
jgi:hypothetical protein